MGSCVEMLGYHRGGGEMKGAELVGPPEKRIRIKPNKVGGKQM